MVEALNLTTPDQIAAARKLPLLLVRKHLEEIEKALRATTACSMSYSSTFTSLEYLRFYRDLCQKRWPGQSLPTERGTIQAIFRNLKRELTVDEIKRMTDLFITQCQRAGDAYLVTMYKNKKKYVR